MSHTRNLFIGRNIFGDDNNNTSSDFIPGVNSFKTYVNMLQVTLRSRPGIYLHSYENEAMNGAYDLMSENVQVNVSSPPTITFQQHSGLDYNKNTYIKHDIEGNTYSYIVFELHGYF